ncbi:MAG TPA: Gfo/Idh/MocA family oxidoreductase [Isosphaeraceae bacterium]
MIGIGLIGYGHWGPNHARTFNGQADSHVVAIADASEKRLEAAQKQVPYVTTSSDHRAVIDHPEVDAVVIATPLTTHYGLVKEALLAGKDVLVEKPLCYTDQESQELCDLAEERGRILMCGHIFLFNSGINKLREYIQDGTLGRVYYMAATRTNLGPVRDDANALYDLGSHDVSIFHHLLGARPLEAAAWGESFLQHEVEDVVFANLEYPDKTLCHMHVSWLNPRKERTLVVVGETKMAVWDDMQPLESIRLYDKGLGQQPHYDSFGQFQLVLRDADILIPKLKAVEPLVAQDTHFLECVRERKAPLSDGPFARDVVASLEALQRSLHRGGSRQRVNDRPRRPAPALAAQERG